MQKDILVLSSDNFYAIHSYALVKSIDTNSKYDNLEIHVLSDRIKDKNKRTLSGCTNIPIVFHEFDRAFLNRNPLPKKITYLPKSAYLRLFIPEIFPSEERIVYVDVDTLVLGNIKELFERDFNGKSCLACHDFGNTPTKQSIYKKFMKQNDSPYFNSGLMVINIKKWIQDQVKKRAYQLLEGEMKAPEYADQEVLNVILENDWKALEPYWNYPPHISDYNDLPKLIHFMGYKPIYKDYKGKHKDTFYYYLVGSKWEGKDYGILKKGMIKGPYKLKTWLVKILRRIL